MPRSPHLEALGTPYQVMVGAIECQATFAQYRHRFNFTAAPLATQESLAAMVYRDEDAGTPSGPSPPGWGPPRSRPQNGPPPPSAGGESAKDTPRRLEGHIPEGRPGDSGCNVRDHAIQNPGFSRSSG